MKEQIINLVKEYTNTFFITPISENKSVIMLLFSYAPFKKLNAQEYAQLDAYYLISNSSYHKANELASKLNKIGVKASYNFELNYKKLAHNINFTGVGKNTLTYIKTLGSRFVMQAIEIDNKYEHYSSNEQITLNCNECNRCVKACPTNAISIKGAEHFNYKKCLRHLQESNEQLNNEQVNSMQNKHLGCDICQAVCPYNNSQKLVEMPDYLQKLLKLENLLETLKNNQKTKTIFAPIIGKNYARQKVLLPNALIVAGNSKNKNLIKNLKHFTISENQIIKNNSNLAVKKLINDKKN
jgi:ferredoxin